MVRRITYEIVGVKELKAPDLRLQGKRKYQMTQTTVNVCTFMHHKLSEESLQRDAIFNNALVFPCVPTGFLRSTFSTVFFH